MPKFELTVNGSNFLAQFHTTDRRRKHGFATKFFVEAATPEAAEAAAIEHLHGDQDILAVMRNAPSDPPTLQVERIAEIPKWPKVARPRIGLVWYPEDGKPPEGTQKERRRRSHPAP